MKKHVQDRVYRICLPSNPGPYQVSAEFTTKGSAWRLTWKAADAE